MPTLSKILGNFNKTLKQFEQFSANCKHKVDQNNKSINKLRASNTHLEADINKADKVASNIKGILGE